MRIGYFRLAGAVFGKLRDDRFRNVIAVRAIAQAKSLRLG